MDKPNSKTSGGWMVRAAGVFEEFLTEEVAARPLVNKLRTAVQFVWLVWRGFSVNRCPVRAAALSYTTLLALVPLLALVLGVSKSLLHDTSADLVPKLMDQLVTYIAPAIEYMPVQGQAAPVPGKTVASSQAKREAVAQIQKFIDNINGGALSTIGSILLAFVSIRLLMTIEQTFNDIWGVEQGRSIWRKVVYYWTTITLGPLLLLLAVYLTGRVEFLNLVNKFGVIPGFEKVLLELAPFVVLWIGFALMYALMPNTPVRPHAALIGGIVGGTLWQLNNLLNTLYISRVVTYSKIYGALGIIPVFLAGLYLSWLIVLFGAQVSYAAQNIRAYLRERAAERLDQRQRELIACRIVLLACENFLHGTAPLSLAAAAEQCRIPSQWLNQLVARLIAGGVLTETTADQPGLQPARPPETITVADVLHVVRNRHGVCGEIVPPNGSEPVAQVLAQLDTASRVSPANANFRDLAGQQTT